MKTYNAYELHENGRKFVGSTKIGTYKGMNKEEFKQSVEKDVIYKVEIEEIK